MNWRGTLDLFCKSCIWGGAGRRKIICQLGEQSRQLEKVGRKNPPKTWSKPVEGVRSKDLKSDLEIMLTQHSSCVCSQGTAPGSQVALRGVTDRPRRLGVPCPWRKPRQRFGAWRGQDRSLLPARLLPAMAIGYFRQMCVQQGCTCRCSRAPHFEGHLKRSNSLFNPLPACADCCL